MPRDGALRACAQPLDPLNEQPPNSDIQKRSIVLRGHQCQPRRRFLEFAKAHRCGSSANHIGNT